MAQGNSELDPNEVERLKKEILAHARGESKEGPPSAMMGVGLQFVVTVLICLFAGQWLDKRLGTYPWLMIAGMLVGGGVGFWSLIRVAKAENERQEARGKRSADHSSGDA